jgi:tetratricopeptide (TPR) repeat protein
MVIGVVVTLTTWPRFVNDLAWDDAPILSALRTLMREHRLLEVLERSTVSIVLEQDLQSSLLDLYRPLSLLSLAAVDGLLGPDPVWQHTANLLLHLACAGLIYALAQRKPFALPSGWAAFASAWFALLPALGEAHLWISGRFDLQATLLCLLAVGSWLRAVQYRSGPLALSYAILAGTCFLGSLLSKEVAVLAAPALLLLPGMGTLRARLRAWLPFALAMATYAVIRVAAIGTSLSGDGTDLRLLALHAGACVFDGLVTIVIPGQVYVRAPVEDYRALGEPVLLALGALFLCGCGLGYRFRRRQPALVWSLLWFVLALAPALPVTTVLWPGFNRYLYLPASLLIPGLCVGLCAVVARLPQLSPRLLRGMAVVYLGSSALWLGASAFDWKDSLTVYGSIVRVAPQRSHGWAWLGRWALHRKDYSQALQYLQKAVALAPDEVRYQAGLGQALLFTRHMAEARAFADRARARWPERPEFRLLSAYARLQDTPAEAIGLIVECLRIDRSHHECRDALRFLQGSAPTAMGANLAPAIAERIAQEPDPALRAELTRITGEPGSDGTASFPQRPREGDAPGR